MKVSPSGFSLVEVMVASTLFLITIAGVTSATRTLTNASQHQENMTMALHLSAFTMEELLLRFKGSSELDANVAHTRQFSRAGAPVVSGGFYVATWTSAWVPGVANLRQLDLTMSWPEAGEAKSVRFMTYRQ